MADTARTGFAGPGDAEAEAGNLGVQSGWRVLRLPQSFTSIARKTQVRAKQPHGIGALSTGLSLPSPLCSKPHCPHSLGG